MSSPLTAHTTSCARSHSCQCCLAGSPTSPACTSRSAQVLKSRLRRHCFPSRSISALLLFRLAVATSLARIVVLLCCALLLFTPLRVVALSSSIKCGGSIRGARPQEPAHHTQQTPYNQPSTPTQRIPIGDGRGLTVPSTSCEMFVCLFLILWAHYNFLLFFTNVTSPSSGRLTRIVRCIIPTCFGSPPGRTLL